MINYYYGIEVNELKKRDCSFIFNMRDKRFELIEFDGDEYKLIEVYSLLNTLKIETDEIIFNTKRGIATHYENKKYILLKKYDSGKEILDLSMILNYDRCVPTQKKLIWKELWIRKLDYYEIQLQELGGEYSFLNQSFYYYLGLSELAINLLNYINPQNIVCSIAHKRVEKVADIFNPINIIVDSKIRDIAEYIKNSFFYKTLDLKEIIDFFKNIKISKDEVILLISRLIYPSYYFDVYEKIYLKKTTQKELEKLLKKNAEYEAFLKKIYMELKFLYHIPRIEFLEY